MFDGKIGEESVDVPLWAGHVERMKEDRLPRMAYVHQEREREIEEDHG